jgi:hypothetical protein
MTRQPALVDVDSDDGIHRAVRFPVKATHTARSIVHSALGLLFAALAAASVAWTVADPAWDAALGSLVLAGFAALFLSTGILAIAAARHGLGIDLTPVAIIVGLGGDRRDVPWAGLVSVAASNESGDDVVLLSIQDGTAVIVPCQKLKADPVVVYYSLCYYFTHSEERSELDGEAALRRVTAGRLT